MDTTANFGSAALVEMELWLEIINLGLGLWVLWVVYGMRERVRGVMEHVLNLFALGIVAFSVVQMVGILTLTGVANFDGWANLAELVLIVSLLLAVYNLRKLK